MRWIIVAGWLAGAVAAPAWGQSLDDLLAGARASSQELTRHLAAALKSELAVAGPQSAVSVCRDLAPQMTGALSRDSGARIARVSLKTRNPLLGMPDAWEQQVLADFDRRAAAGENPALLEHWDTVSEPEGRYFRYMRAIPVQPLCLACHGDDATVGPEVRARLQAEYPHDRARGYTLGQIRGAVTVKRPLP